MFHDIWRRPLDAEEPAAIAVAAKFPPSARERVIAILRQQVATLVSSQFIATIEPIHALRRIGKPAKLAIPELIEALNHDNFALATAAADALAAIETPSEDVLSALRANQQRLGKNASDAIARLTSAHEQPHK